MSIEIAPSITGVSFDGVHFGYGSSGQAVLRNIDWQIDEGEFVVVAGESGSGKSTLLRCLNGLVPHFSGGRFGGSVVVNGFDTKQHGPRALSTSVGFVFQDPDSQRVAAIVEDELAFGMEQLGIARMTMRKRVEETLDLLGIADLRDREMETLSGGERQRVAVGVAQLGRRHLHFGELPPDVHQIELRAGVEQLLRVYRACAHAKILSHAGHGAIGEARCQRLRVHAGDERHVVHGHHARQNRQMQRDRLRRLDLVRKRGSAGEQISECDADARFDGGHFPDRQP